MIFYSGLLRHYTWKLITLFICIPESQVTVGKIYGAMLMFEHWRAYKNRKSDHVSRLNPRDTLIQRVTVEEAANSQNAYNDSHLETGLKPSMTSQKALSNHSLASIVSAVSNVRVFMTLFSRQNNVKFYPGSWVS